MATAASSALECPVCHEGFTEPKILPCAHLVCRKCVLSWLEKGGDQNGCPLCRAPILPDSIKGQGDLASQVDALPTDSVTAVVLECEKMLSRGHVCGCSEEAVVFCLQCAIKFCSSCAKCHARIPSTQDHITEELSDLSAEQLAAHHQTLCRSHKGKPAELYCSEHEELMCVLCVSTHRQCSMPEGVGDAATAKREELKASMQKLVEKEAAVTAKVNQLNSQIVNAVAEFKAMRDEVTAAFDDVQKSLESRQQKLLAEIRSREEAYMAERKSSILDLENLQAALSANRSRAEQLISSAPDSALLDMLGKLKARMETLASEALPEDPMSTPGSGLVRAATVEKMKQAVDAIGMLKEDNRADDKCPWCGCSVEGPAFAAVIKAGDRVRRGKDWCYVDVDGSPPGVGTVISLPPSAPSGWAWVKWDCGGILYRYRVGAGNCYELKLVFET